MWLEDYMNVIGHDSPRNQVISFAVKVPQGILNQFSNLRISQMALPMSCIEIRLDSIGIEFSKLAPLLPSEFTALPLGLLNDPVPLCAPTFKNMGG
jgi:hypothetical protein